ncbi:hypothetical protein MMC22_003932 [Lobaria immixta]|nr:hypothetical protein [Lobaria immixta]
MTTTYAQQQLTLPSLGRGSHLITPHITSSLSSSSSTAPISNIKHGLLHLFLQHTSCALTLNENWDEDVRADMSDALDGIAPEDTAHIKSSLIGASVSVPITDGNLALGTWQGIWFLEFRNGKQRRKVLATVQGVKM